MENTHVWLNQTCNIVDKRLAFLTNWKKYDTFFVLT